MNPQEVPLTYTIAFATPHSGRYGCENILVDNPNDQNSRWSGAHQGSTKQWLLLRLESLAVLRKITFGKFSKQHPCNMKEFKVYIGLTEENMVQVFHGGLKNNSEPESFNIRHVDSAGIAVPTRYVKVEPIASHGQSFHVSIWHIAMSGIIDPEYIERVRLTYEEHREKIVMRHILKHLRQRRLLTPFKSIAERAGLRLENPLVSRLHEKVVLQGDWRAAEQLLDILASTGLFAKYLHSCEPQAFWTCILGTDADGDVPSPRGGHAMCMDPENQIIYVFGGWDGQRSLDDFWAYHVKQDKWQLLSPSTTKEPNAPGARSCHKMVFDSKTGSIYLMGRLADSDVRPSNTAHGRPGGAGLNVPQGMGTPQQSQSPLRQQMMPPPSQAPTPQMNPNRTYCSEFYRYQTRGVDAGKWTFLSFDTASSGGPPLVFDLQMVMDSEAQILYVFGGRVVDGDWDTMKYAGLYGYNVRTSRWKLLQDPKVPSPNTIPPRYGHSMVFEPITKRLYIFGGQREQKYLSDMYVYDIATNTSTEIYSKFSLAGGPDPCFTQRAVIDPDFKEIYVFCGLTRSNVVPSQNNALTPSNWAYRYSSEAKPGKWSQITRHPESPPEAVPVPRFAHQVVYHPETRTVFLHGGNAGSLGQGNLPPRREAPITPSANDLAGSSDVNQAPPNLDGAPPSEQQNTETSPPPPQPVIRATMPERGSAPPGPPSHERRLDDFWKMELRRPQVEEVIRRAKFHIRRQQFREMCEGANPVQALQFLQNEVSDVVDHRDPDESDAFRGLLTHLLVPQRPARHPPTLATDSTSDGGASDGWTNQIPGEADMDASSWLDDPTARGTAESLRGIIDPLEVANVSSLRGANPPTTLTAERYQQRTEVFSSILEYVAEEEKEPVGDLFHVVLG